ncbi:hypothetical protein BH10CYA1_BH10CYA1_08610 [soil metagenome]
MNSSIKSAIALSLLYLIGAMSPVFAQVSSAVESLDELGSLHSNFVDIDIVTNSPTLQSQSPNQQSQPPVYETWTSTGSVETAVPQQNGMVQQSAYSADSSQYPGLTPSSVVAQSAAKQPIQIDSQTVGRVVGVAGTALILGAFLKNGGVGGVMNSFGLDNRFHSRGPSLAPY